MHSKHITSDKSAVFKSKEDLPTTSIDTGRPK